MRSEKSWNRAEADRLGVRKAAKNFTIHGDMSMRRHSLYIESDRLVICNLRNEDFGALKAMRCDQRIYRYEPTFLTELQGSPEEALKAIQDMDLNEDRQCVLGVYEKKDLSVLVGLAELYDYKPSGKVISIGYRFLPEYWGKGIATACVRALIDYLQNNTEVQLVTAHVLPENKASSRCLLKNGFEYLLTKKEDWGYDRLSTADVYTLDC